MCVCECVYNTFAPHFFYWSLSLSQCSISDDQWAVCLCFIYVYLQIFCDLRNILVVTSLMWCKIFPHHFVYMFIQSKCIWCSQHKQIITFYICITYTYFICIHIHNIKHMYINICVLNGLNYDYSLTCYVHSHCSCIVN